MVRPRAAGYDCGVAEIDEARARSALGAMQDRLVRGPIAALGISASATAEDARSAFLQLTKQYHPVRFGRMAVDIQKQAHEVFLALRAAHDSVLRTLRRGTGPIAISPTPVAISGPATAPVSAPHGAPSPSPSPSPSPHGAPPAVSANGRGGAQALPMRGPRPPGQDAAGAPTAGLRSGASRPVAAPAVPVAPVGPAASGRTPGVARPAGSTGPITAQDEAAVVDLLQRQQWNQARSALHQLSARDPGSKRIRALECYARGREAQLDRRLDDARVELQDALDLDPDLQLAKTALTELFTRRK
jgi:hypothetical protein